MSASAIDRRELRRTLACFPTGVTVVTAVAPDGEYVGLTVNSFNSLSLDPPLVLWSLTSASRSMAAFEQATHFAINILAEDQVEISRLFSSKATHKFENMEVKKGIGGAPLLAGCAAYIECRSHSRQRGGDHMLFIGEVERHRASSRRPLVFLHGHYVTADGPSASP